MVRFAHLHCHSHFSLLDGNARIDDLCAAAARCGQPRIALTDHGNMFGAIQFYRAAEQHGLTPIIGCEVFVAARDHTSRDPNQPVHHLTILAENEAGYHNLIKLATRAYLDGFYFKPRVDKPLLAAHARGLVALSGCMSGEVSSKVLAGDLDAAARLVGEYGEIFGKNGFFIEIMENGIPLQARQREGLIEVARRTGTPALLTNDVHYVRQEQAAAREVMMCIASGKTFQDETRRRLDTDQHHFRSSEEMATLFRGAERLCEEASALAERCNVRLKFDEMHLPRFQVPTGEALEEYFDRLCREGCARRYGRMDEALAERLRYETSVIKEAGFVAYFLIVADFVRHARSIGVPVGPGRGSAAGSIVAFSLGITDVDPLRYDLLFERFLNRGRVSMPDIDIDFCRDRREEILHYVQEKYGRSNVCQIVTFGTLAARAAIRDTGRVLGIDLAKVDAIAKKVPSAVNTKLQDALEQDEELKKLRETDAEARKLFDISLTIEGLNRHASTHAAGVVITDRPLEEYVPLCRVQDEVNTQYSMNDLESIGLLKMDFLGLKTLTILARAVEMIRAAGREVVLEELPLDDRGTYELLQRGDTTGVFQLESAGMRQLLQKMKPDVFEDIVAILALFRPGPLGSGMVDSFVRRKHGLEEIEYPHPSLEAILKETYGVMVYQEQIMRISNVLAGFTLEEADNLRKAMGKKKPEVMERYQSKFVAGAVARGIERGTAEDIWTRMALFAGYGFNKSHTVAYGIITYRTAWLKANFPREFLAASMSVERSDTDKVAALLEECRLHDIGVLLPDLNASDLDFAIDGGAIRFGLGAIKGVGEKPVQAVLAARRRLGRPFRSLIEVFEEADAGSTSKAVYEAFVAAGAFDWTRLPRARVDAALDTLLRIGQAVQRDRKAGQLTLFAASAAPEAGLRLPDVPEWPEREKLAREKAALGFYLSGSPLSAHARTLGWFSSHGLADLPAPGGHAEVTVGGMVQGLRTRTTKRGRAAGQKMALFRITGLEGAPLQAVCFAEDYRRAAQDLVDDAICLFSGTMDASREEPTLRVVKVEPFQQILARRVERVILTVQEPDDPLLARIQACIKKNAGSVPVYLLLQRPQGGHDLVRCGARFQVKVTEEALEAFAELVGAENVKLR
ncbi:MAG: DNA polymerase III subunit alpha [Planctomycetes bacterium]|nr:DNA polymerase III subunit alpha [Planctomycetota bacterium]